MRSLDGYTMRCFYPFSTRYTYSLDVYTTSAEADGTTLPCAYVYAVSTDPAQQGHGYASALMRRFAAEADANGCVLYTLPAEASLYAWYQSVMGTTQTARGARLRIARAPDMQRPPVIERVSAQEYAALREQALRGRAHVELSAALLSQHGQSAE